jgi:Holliday junction DNA helicase RuvA
MIGKLTGKIDALGGNQLLLDVNGVGYIVFASRRTLSRIGGKGDVCSVLIETHVREDHIHLYGFADAVEQDWFNLLTKVQGVGAKVGLAILSVASPNDLSLAIAAQDKAVFTQAEGVGPKLGTRIVTELKDKVGAMDLSPSSPASMSNNVTSPMSVSDEGGDHTHEALSALVNLGYGRSEAMIAINRAKQHLAEDADLSALIKQGLKELSA